MESGNTQKDIFLGFKAYSETDVDIFKGREQDTEYLYNLVINKDYVVCYAESGEGKSSLIEAGLVPRLKANRYFPVRISFTDEEYNNTQIDFDKVIKDRILDAVKNQQMSVRQQSLSFISKTDSVLNDKFSNDLWWFLRHNELSLYGISFPIVLIFDQFEEVMNYPKSESWTSRFFAFLEKISTDNCPQYILDEMTKCDEIPDVLVNKEFKAVFSIRTEYIGELDYWCMQRYFIPALKHNRFCLKPLTLQGADEVMKQYDGFGEDLRNNIKKILAKSANVNDSDTCVSALILSVICTSLYHNKDKKIAVDSISNSIENFYNDIIEKCNITVEERNTIASVLVDKDKRVRVASDCAALEKIDFNKKYKDALLKNRLIKKSNVNGVEYIELVHDSLIDVVKKHKEDALQKELRKKRRRNVSIISFLSLILLVFVFMLIGLKKNEKNFLIAEAKFVSAETERLFNDKELYLPLKLLNHVAKNNKECLNVPEFEEALRRTEEQLLPEKCFDYENPILYAEYSPDGKYIATIFGDNYNDVVLLSAEDGSVINTLNLDKVVQVLSFSEDGNYIVTSDVENVVKIWSVKDGNCVKVLDDKFNDIHEMELSDDGKYLLVASSDAEVWSVDDEKCLYTFDCGEYDVTSVRFTPDEKYVITDTKDNVIGLWSLENGQQLWEAKDEKGYFGNIIDISPNGEYLATTTVYQPVSNVFSMKTGELLWTIKHHENDEISAVLFSKDGKYIATSGNNEFKLWSVDDRKCMWSVDNFNIDRDERIDHGQAAEIRLSPNGKYLCATNSYSGSRLFSIENGECVLEVKNSTISDFSSDGTHFVTVCENVILLWSLEHIENVGLYKQKLDNPERYLSELFTPDGKYVLRSGRGIELWSVESGKLIDTLYGISGMYQPIFSQDGKYVILRPYINVAALWNIENDSISYIGDIYAEYMFNTLLFTFDGNHIVTVEDAESTIYSNPDGSSYSRREPTDNNAVYVLPLNDDDTLKYIVTDNRIYSAYFDSSGEHLYTTTADSVQIWSMENLELIDMMALEDRIYTTTYSHDKKNVIATFGNNIAKLYSVENKECLLVMKHDAKIVSSVFSPDGKYIVTISEDKKMKLWSVEERKYIPSVNKAVTSVLFTDEKSMLILSEGTICEYKIEDLSEILDRMSDILGPNAELTEEENQKYYLN